ncbi:MULTISPECIES: AAA family ATPase [Acinetobacter]|uniref:AAA family ATPase n=1 Tax=Acinetobacter TaxID=469 RepID=UPI0011166DBB|nr:MULTISPECIES: ATP-binding protein [Acinetobacter]MBJ8552249.1 AAA family ATPase [Acinetobacter bereziniae]MBJ9371874.1 AAA family ATPase [Acinetobacter sp. TGL-Y2]MDM1786330.1 AAA family ATPase [Acinetobacter bereziniae]TNL52931.1 ATP-binding protein [Acinetobacter bereziniae]TNL57306.1 ATP-binding protein [Acinetobacter bereziniae]
MLESIWIENFKSYKTGQTLPLAPITLLIGANASGKSNAIEAFRFLSWFAGGEKLSTIKNRINDSEKIFRGDFRNLFYLNEKHFSLGVSLSIGLSQNFEKWNFSIEYCNDEDFKVKNEEIFLRDGEVFCFIDNKVNTLMHNFKKDFLNINGLIPQNKIILLDLIRNDVVINRIEKNVDSDSSALTTISGLVDEQLSKYLEDNNHNYTALQLITELFLIRSIFSVFFYFYDFAPSKMRQDSLSSNRLHQNGENLSGVLYYLWHDEENNCQNDILKFVSSLPEQDFKTLKFYKDHRDRVELALVENFAGKEKEWGIELLSDGTLRVLGIAAAILSAPKESTIVIEEIDNGIHPSRAKYLLDTMFYFAEKKNLKLLLSTHNPALMDALPDQALGDVVFAYRDPKEGDSRLVRLSDLEDYVGLVSQGPLGELVTQGIVDRFVKNPISRDDKKQKALSWLNEMRGASNE